MKKNQKSKMSNILRNDLMGFNNVQVNISDTDNDV